MGRVLDRLFDAVNRKVIHLWQDEEGAVLAFSSVIMLTLITVVFSVYAVGETVRQKIELQNAADAATYSAAVVQADAVSRVASLNRALGWTYAMLARREMDYIVYCWLKKTQSLFERDEGTYESACQSDNCWRHPNHSHEYSWVGEGDNRRKVKIFDNRWVKISDIDSLSLGTEFVGEMRTLKENIQELNSAIDQVVNGDDESLDLQQRIALAVEEVLKSNLADGLNDRTGQQDADIRFILDHDAESCFGEPTSEDVFLRMLYGRSMAASKEIETFQTEPEEMEWYTEYDGDRIGRKYDSSHPLHSWWRWRYWTCHVSYDEDGNPDHDQSSAKSGRHDFKVFTASDIGADPEFFETGECHPRALTRAYFEKEGAIVVGVARRMQNPFQFMFSTTEDQEPGGIFSFFTPRANESGKGRYMWAASAARAGYRDTGRTLAYGTDEGVYNATVDSFEIQPDTGKTAAEAHDKWTSRGQHNGWQGGDDNGSKRNLTVTDWDAVFIPLREAWSWRVPAWQNRKGMDWTVWDSSPEAGRWEREAVAYTAEYNPDAPPRSDSGRRVLEELYSSPDWRKLYGDADDKTSLRAICDDSSPSSVNLSEAVSLGGANIDRDESLSDYVLH